MKLSPGNSLGIYLFPNGPSIVTHRREKLSLEIAAENDAAIHISETNLKLPRKNQ